jgi:hypothetical protein
MNAELQRLCLSFRERAFLLPRFFFIPHPFIYPTVASPNLASARTRSISLDVSRVRRRVVK